MTPCTLVVVEKRQACLSSFAFVTVLWAIILSCGSSVSFFYGLKCVANDRLEAGFGLSFQLPTCFLPRTSVAVYEGARLDMFLVPAPCPPGLCSDKNSAKFYSF